MVDPPVRNNNLPITCIPKRESMEERRTRARELVVGSLRPFL